MRAAILEVHVALSEFTHRLRSLNENINWQIIS